MSHIRVELTQANRATELSQDKARDNKDLAGAIKSMQQLFSNPPRPGKLPITKTSNLTIGPRRGRNRLIRCSSASH